MLDYNLRLDLMSRYQRASRVIVKKYMVPTLDRGLAQNKMKGSRSNLYDGNTCPRLRARLCHREWY